MKKVFIYNKKFNCVEEEKVYYGSIIRFLYSSNPFAKFISNIILFFIAKLPFFSKKYGDQQSSPKSKKKVLPFIKEFHLKVEEFEKKPSEFTSFNDFFTRKLKANARSINRDKDVIVSPCDARVHVIENIDSETSFMIKGQFFDLKKLLKDNKLVQHYKGGSAFLARLCPTDYHRFHFPVDGICTKPRLINGPLYSVNPIAVFSRPSIFWENKRYISEIKTQEFGKVLMIEIGATYVGVVHYTCSFGTPIKKGDEKGYFAFGGSSMMLIFEKDQVAFDPILIEKSKQGIEVITKMGEMIAIKKVLNK